MTEVVPQKRERARLLFVFLAGPAAWAIELLAGYVLVQVGCTGPLAPTYILAGIMALIVLVSGLLALRGWRDSARRQDDQDQDQDQDHAHVAVMDLDRERPEGARAFITISGTLLSTLFFLLIVLTGVTFLFLSPCPIITMPLP